MINFFYSKKKMPSTEPCSIFGTFFALWSFNQATYSAKSCKGANHEHFFHIRQLRKHIVHLEF